jgi:hypothetical protein
VVPPLPPVGTQLEAVLDRANFHAAFDHVAENGGCRGADGVTIGEFRERLDERLDFLEPDRTGHHPAQDRRSADHRKRA